MVDQSLAVALEKPGIGDFGSERAVDAHHLDLQPEARHHPFAADIVQDLRQAISEAALRRQPLPHRGPPCFPQFGIPARIDDKIFAACLRRAVDHRKQFFGGRIARQAVHIIVENHRQGRHVRMRCAHDAAGLGERPQRLLQTAFDEAKGCGNTRETPFRLQAFAPQAFPVGGAANPQAELVREVAHLPVP